MKADAIKDPKGNTLLSSIKEFEDECQNEFVESRHVLVDWETLLSKGFTCAPVEIREIKKEEKV